MQFCRECNRTYPADYRVCPRHNIPLEGREELEPGMIVREKYKILSLIGDGAMGRVWLVEDLDFTYRTVRKAMKVPLPALAGDPAYVQRFRDEAAKAGVLEHPNVVRTEHIDRTESGTPFLLMELIEGRSLRWWLERQPRMPWRHSAEIGREIASALEAAHGAGLVHCDIKPENVLAVTKSAPYPLKVTDFGLAKATMAPTAGVLPTDRVTTWGNDIVAGTPAYISPEQAVSRGNVGPATDIYSLGVMLYEMMAGHTPYGRIESVDQARVLHQQPVPEIENAAEFPPPLIQLTFKMLARDPAHRPAAASVVTALRELLQTADAATAPLAAAASTPSTTIVEVAPPAPGSAPTPPYPSTAPTMPTPPGATPVRPVAPAPAAASSHHGFQAAPPPVQKSRKGLLLLLAVGIGVTGIAVIIGGVLSRNHEPPPATATGGSAGSGGSQQSASQILPPLAEITPIEPPASAPEETTKTTPPEPAHPPRQAKGEPPRPPTPPPPDAESLYKQGTDLLRAGNRDDARKYLEQAAGLGHTNSMLLLGTMFSEAKQYDDAFGWFQKAANSGSARGMYYLGTFYETGKSVPVSAGQAIYWYTKSANLGFTLAQERLKFIAPRQP